MRQSALRALWAMRPLIVASLLTGCGAAGGCDLVPLRTYSAAFSTRLVDEVEAAPGDAVWPEAMRDYVTLRDAVRACRATS